MLVAVAYISFFLSPLRLAAREGHQEDQPLRMAKQKTPLANGLTPAEAAKAMTVPEGFEVSLIAGEPDVHQPIAMAIDDRGRLWIAEAHTYPLRAPKGQGRDKIIILEDADGNGSFETRKTFIEGLNLVSGLEVGFGGVWVGAAPYLLFIPDRDGDDRPDTEPQVLLDGFGYEDTHETLNSFVWGPDGWLYGCHGVFTHSRVGKPGTPDDQRTPMNAAYWRYHPTRHEFEVFAWGTSNSWGIDFDDHGQAFSTACVIPHLYHVIQGARYQRQAGQHFNPFVFDDIKTIATHRHYAGDIRDHAWWGREPVLPESTSEAGGGHAHCGAMVYLGDNWPEQFRRQLFMNNIHGNRVNMDRLERSGSGYVGKRAPDFLFANDHWFRGISLKYGPDGGVYLIDWYDRNACHRTTPEIWDRTNGRVYKITYGSVPRSSLEPGGLAKLTDRQLVDLVHHRNDWYVRMARRVLQQRAATRPLDAAARTMLLNEIAKQDGEARVVLRAMWALHVTSGLSETEILTLLDSPDEYVRAWAIQLELEDRDVSSRTYEKLVSLAHEDESPLVRLYLASAMQRLPVERRWAIAEPLVLRAEDADDHNLPLMIWYGVEPAVLSDKPRALRLAFSSKIPVVARYVVRRAAMDREGLAAVIEAIGRVHEPNVQRMLLGEVQVSLQGRVKVPMPEPWSRVYSRLVESSDVVVRDSAIELAVKFGDKRTFPQLRELAADRGQDVVRRKWALDTLLDGNDAGAVTTLFGLLDEPELRGPALRGLARFDHAKTPEAILSRYHTFSDEQKRDAINTLSSRPSYSLALLNAAEAGDVPGRDIHAYVIRQIRRFDNPEINRKILTVWGNIRQTSDDKQAAIAEYKSRLTPDRLADADPMVGRGVFDKVCASCHKLFGSGDNIGPDLTGSNRANLDYILENVLDPSAVVGKDYQLTIIETADGRVISGLVQLETDSAVTIRTINDTVVVAKDDIEARRQDAASMMPDNLLANLKESELDDLIAYLASPTQVPPRGQASPIDPTTGRVTDAIEGESLKVREVTGGGAQTQDMRPFAKDRWSGQKQLWWTGAKPGDRLELELPVERTGRYEIDLVMTRARDYGIHQLYVDGHELGAPIDLFNDPDVITTGMLSAGELYLDEGVHDLMVRVVGARPDAVQAFMFGLDFVRLVPMDSKE